MLKDRDWLDYVDVFGGLFIGIITFFLGFIFSNQIERRRAKRELRATKKFFEVYWQQQIISAEKQIEEMKGFLNDLENRGAFEGIEIVDQVQPFYMYDSIDKKELVECFRLFGEEVLIVRRMGFVELLRTTCIQYVRLHEIFMERNAAFSNQWNSSMLEFHRMTVQVSSRPLEELKQIPEVIEVNRLYKEAVKTPKPEDMLENLVLPLDTYFSDIYRKNPSNSYVSSFIPILSNLKLAIHQSRGVRAGFANGFRYQIKVLEESFQKAKD